MESNRLPFITLVVFIFSVLVLGLVNLASPLQAVSQPDQGGGSSAGSYFCFWAEDPAPPLKKGCNETGVSCTPSFEPNPPCSDFKTKLDCNGSPQGAIERACKVAPKGTIPTPTPQKEASAITLYENKNFNNYDKDEGKARYGYSSDVQNFYAAAIRFGVSSIKITEGTWEVCEKENYGWRCLELNKDAPDLGEVKVDGGDLDDKIHSLRRIDDKSSIPPRIVFFQNENYGGKIATFDGDTSKVSGFGITSIKVLGGTWEVCEKENYLGSCLTLSDNVASLKEKGLNDKISSLRRAGVEKTASTEKIAPIEKTAPIGELEIKNPLKFGTVPLILDSVSGFLYALALAVVTVMVLWGAFQILTAAGSPAQIDKGKQTLLWAVIGTVVVLIAGGIAGIIKDILGGPA